MYNSNCLLIGYPSFDSIWLFSQKHDSIDIITKQLRSSIETTIPEAPELQNPDREDDSIGANGSGNIHTLGNQEVLCPHHRLQFTRGLVSPAAVQLSDVK
ncbi:hypothetical protein HPP92_011741 [Vanilla planifolia]|uniref:Uncharacterized protein n=1 Tax=Vanilla planifolia TaxID=51239 RepID=A0A835RCY2_VANPL|nr:hypothetical protein HPP92_011741 [Vanilla planifolia]